MEQGQEQERNQGVPKANPAKTVLQSLRRRLLAPIATTGTSNQSERERWLAHTLQQIPQGNRILDAGAGTLRYRPLCGHLDYISQDFCQYDGVGDGSALDDRPGWCQTEIDVVSDITSIPLESASFDAVMCIEVLEHVPDPAGALRELVQTVARVAGKRIHIKPIAGPVGVQSRNFSNALIYTTGWKARVMLENGIDQTYPWVAEQVRMARRR